MLEQHDLQKQKGGQGDQQHARRAADQISFYDESLKKHIEGSFVSDGKDIHVHSVYGIKSIPYNDLGACIDYNSQILLVQKVLRELARDPGGSKDLHQQKDDQQPQPMERPIQGEAVVGAGQGGEGTSP